MENTLIGWVNCSPPPSKGAALHLKCLHKSLALLPLAPWSVLHKVGTSDYYKYNTALDSVIEGNLVERDRRKMSRRRQKIKLLLVVVVWCK